MIDKDDEKLIVLAEDEGYTMKDGVLVREDIRVLPAEETAQLKLGWTVTEEIGVGLVNPRGLLSGRKSTADSSRPKYKKTRLSDG